MLPIGGVPVSTDYWKNLDASSKVNNPILIIELPTKTQILMWANNQLEGIPLGELSYNYFISQTNYLAKIQVLLQFSCNRNTQTNKFFIKDCNYWITGYDFLPHPISSCRLFENSPAAPSQKCHCWLNLLMMEFSNVSKFCLHLFIDSACGWVQN